MEPFFEQQPWLLVPVIILVTEAWQALKRAFSRTVHRVR